jgi:hypothetical protein
MSQRPHERFDEFEIGADTVEQQEWLTIHRVRPKARSESRRPGHRMVSPALPGSSFTPKNKSARFLELSFIDLDLSEPILQNFHVA